MNTIHTENMPMCESQVKPRKQKRQNAEQKFFYDQKKINSNNI